MLEFLFVDIPIVLIGYGLIVFILSHFAGSVSEVETATGHHVSSDSNTETWSVDHEPEELTRLDEDETALFDPMAMIEFDEEEVESESLVLESHVPSDVILRRHYLTHLSMMLETLHPQPEDAVLKRHHEQWLTQRIEALVMDPQAVEALEADYEARHICVSPVATQQVHGELSHLPTDVVLRRHFLTHLRMMLESLHPEPTDSVLHRHYQQLLETQVLGAIECRGKLEALEAAYESKS